MNKIKLQLTDTEWIQLLDGNSNDSELPVCCANISALRDVFVEIVRNGRNEPIASWFITNLQQKLKWVSDGHELTPLLKKICQQIDFDPQQVEHKENKHE